MFQMAGLSTENKTNHSLRATSISRMFHAEVPEKIIMERSGHLTKEGVRSYERTTNDQIKDVSHTLSSTVLPDTTLSSTLPDAELLTSDENKARQGGISIKSKKDEIGEVMKHVNFQSMTDCTFNINLNFNQ